MKNSHHFTGSCAALAMLWACSVVNAPSEVQPPGIGTGGAGGDPGTPCDNASDCETDDDLCTVDTCEKGFCKQAILDPDDSDGCTTDACDPRTGVVTNVLVSLKDGNVCTLDSCDPKTGLVNPLAVVLFSADFASDADADDWTVEMPWEIGPAQASPVSQTSTLGFLADPGTDHSEGDDNRLAGVVIGGFADATSTTGVRYLESRAFDATISEGALVLGYFRMLISESEPLMSNTVEVWDGANWRTVFNSSDGNAQDPAKPYADTQWQRVQHTITPFANAVMRIRFGFEVGTAAPLVDAPSWSIDDVRVFNVAVDVNDGDPCTQDICDPTQGAVHAVLSVDDKNVCTVDACTARRGVTHKDTSMRLFADFGSDNHGWSLQSEWQVGPAMGSQWDPGQDTSPSSDGRVLGVVLGGNYSVATTHGMAWATSPVSIVTSPKAELTFRRWLTSDTGPAVLNQVQILPDGAPGWVKIWETGAGPAIEDKQWVSERTDLKSWTTNASDLTPLSLQFRFGFAINSITAKSRGGWNIDDVMIRETTCDGGQ